MTDPGLQDYTGREQHMTEDPRTAEVERIPTESLLARLETSEAARAILEAIVTDIRALIPEENPELLDFGYRINAADTLAILSRAGDLVVLREHDAKVLRDAAVDFHEPHDPATYPVGDWLSDRADRIERGEGS